MSSIDKKIAEATAIMRAVGIPVDRETPRRRERMALALLAVAKLKPTTSWEKAAVQGEGGEPLKTRDIISFWNEHYKENVSSGSYDDVRRKDLKMLVAAGVVLRSAGQPDAATNNPTRGYAINPDAGPLLRRYGKPSWRETVDSLRGKAGTLEQRLERTRALPKIKVALPSGVLLKLSTGAHNDLQKAIIKQLLPAFLGGAEVLYVGDTAKKALYVDERGLRELGFPEISHELLPDVVAYEPKRKWIVLIEAVHSANPISKMRHLDLEDFTKGCKAPRIYISAFKDRASFRRWLQVISWETEVWLQDSPEHMIHFNGPKFLGPYAARA